MGEGLVSFKLEITVNRENSTAQASSQSGAQQIQVNSYYLLFAHSSYSVRGSRLLDLAIFSQVSYR